MVRIFKKPDEKKELPHDYKMQLAEASRRLGYEVGYHRHSEIGWVRDKLMYLYNYAEEYDLKDFVQEHYNIGKDEGSKAKDRDTKSGLSKVVSTEEPEVSPNFTIERNKKEYAISNINSGFNRADYTFSSSSDMIKQPDLVELPDNIERAKVVDRPSFLNGAKHLTPRKK
ncbi:hypothetical protein [Methanolobus bombayensis]|uniref:hypothetical protein n=1 Tax=Methanolobus bombayensis TaxID=38023 RepID=UPI001AE3B635|nr:hypothetical protein [Methanolobus bombayensis]MBP1909522.1 hypothetical protein [Methanolobus bombayensis]